MLITGCNGATERMVINRSPDVPQNIVVTSPAFKNGDPLPVKYTTSLDISPPIDWKNLPPGTKSIVLLMEDGDVPSREPYLHWVMYNIPPGTTGLPEAFTHEKKPKMLLGAVQGKNSKSRIGYLHPAPIGSKAHHYHIEIFALDDLIDMESGKNKSEVVTEMNGHVLGKGELICTHKAS